MCTCVAVGLFWGSQVSSSGMSWMPSNEALAMREWRLVGTMVGNLKFIADASFTPSIHTSWQQNTQKIFLRLQLLSNSTKWSMFGHKLKEWSKQCSTHYIYVCMEEEHSEQEKFSAHPEGWKPPRVSAVFSWCTFVGVPRMEQILKISSTSLAPGNSGLKV